MGEQNRAGMRDKSGTCRFDCFQFSHTLVAVAFSYNVQQSTCTCEIDEQLQKPVVLRAFTEPFEFLRALAHRVSKCLNAMQHFLACSLWKASAPENLNGLLLGL